VRGTSRHRVDADRLVEVGDGAVELTLVAVREATVVAGNGAVFRRFATALGNPRVDGNAAVRVAPRTIVQFVLPRRYRGTRHDEKRDD
jgi:hypothetical protein